MTDLKNPAVIWTKGILFLVLGLLASVLLVLQAPSVTVVLLLLLAVWAFCRSYYFAFYVIQHYVDSTYRFSGLLSFLRYACRKCRGHIYQEMGEKAEAEGDFGRARRLGDRRK